MDSTAQDAATTKNQGYCMGFFSGFLAGYALVGNIQNPRYCISGAASPDELREVFMKYVRDNPTSLNKNFAVGLNEALAAAYPCNGKQ